MIKRALLLTVILAGILSYAALQNVQQPEPIPSHLIKITQQGEPISAWSGPWSCVFDRRTGLLWEVKTDDETVHDGYWSYSWFDGEKGIPNAGDCYFKEQGCDTQDQIQALNSEETCGVAQWRLPTRAELLSLIRTDIRPGEPTIATDFFPHTQRGDYWTSVGGKKLEGAFHNHGEGASAVDFVAGSVIEIPYRNAAFVRLVSSQFSYSE